MYCSNCGKDIGDAKFCPDCGTAANAAHTNPLHIPTVSIKPTFDKNKIIIIGFLAVYLLFLLFTCVKISIPYEISASLKFYEIPFMLFQYGEYLKYMDSGLVTVIVLFWLSASIAEVCMAVFCIRGLLSAFRDGAFYASSYLRKSGTSAITLSAIIILAVLILRSAINQALGDYRAFGDLISYQGSAFFLLILGIIGLIVEKKMDCPSPALQPDISNPNTFSWVSSDEKVTNRINDVLADNAFRDKSYLNIQCPECGQELFYQKQTIRQSSKISCPYCNVVFCKKS